MTVSMFWAMCHPDKWRDIQRLCLSWTPYVSYKAAIVEIVRCQM